MKFSIFTAEKKSSYIAWASFRDVSLTVSMVNHTSSGSAEMEMVRLCEHSKKSKLYFFHLAL